MAYYHGTNMLIGAIDLSKSRMRTDFGKGFYLANMLETAQGWAARRAILSGGTPTVMRYEFKDDLFSLSGVRFASNPSTEWLEFISLNRRLSKTSLPDKEPRHEYNWVSGPIANDDIADVVDEYLEGDITSEDAIRRARALPQTYQLSVHTLLAVQLIENEKVSYKQFKNGRWTKDWLKQNT